MSNVVSGTVVGVLVEILKKHGVRHVFGLPAAQFALFMNGTSKDQYFTYATTRHEEAAGHMAHAAHLVTGEMAVCFGTVGPGATNLVPGVAAAWQDNVPMLVLTPNNQLNMLDPDRDVLQRSDHLALFRPITKWSAQIRTPERAPELFERAIYIARSGRPGPVHLDVPCDIGSQPCTYDLDSIPILTPSRPTPTQADIEAVAKALREAKRPLLLAGGGVSRSDATEAFRALVRRTGAPFFTTPKGNGISEPGSPHDIGSPGWFGGGAVVKACREADVILAVGCKFSSWVPIHKPPTCPVPAGQKIIQIDIDDTMLGKNAPITTGLVGDARETLKLLDAALAAQPGAALDRDWVATLTSVQRAYRAEVDAIADAVTTEGTSIVNTAAYMRELARVIPKDAILCMDGGQASSWEMTYLRPCHTRHLAHSAGMGHMGFGLPSSIAAKMVCPDKTVIAVTGDGGAGLTIQELETAARYGVATVLIVMNDSHWGCYRPYQDEVFKNKNLGTQLTDVDFVRVAEGFGCRGERVDRVEELAPALDRAIKSGKPTLLNVITDFTPHPMDPQLWGGVVMHGYNMAG